MSKDSVSAWDTTAANNTDVAGINIAEGMSPADVNNAIRAIMAQLATWFGLSDWGAEGAPIEGNDLNGIAQSGIYAFAADYSNAPIGNSGLVIQVQTTLTRRGQIAICMTNVATNRIFWRERSDAGWGDWREFFHAPVDANGTMALNSTAALFGSITATINPANAEYGVSIEKAGTITASRSGGAPMLLKRNASGTLLAWYVGTTNVGSITESGGVVTYGSFCGAHWSQFPAHARPEILPGTILESISEMCDFEDTTSAETVLPKAQIAQPGSSTVYGVFTHWDDDGSRDFWVASVGANLIRMAPGVSVANGALVEAGADGCGVPQADDLYRARTVAKITSAVPVLTYEDGSRLYPCTLHCG